MLQKILVVIVGLVMSLVGALSPAGLFASKNAAEGAALDAKNAVDQTLATVRTADSSAFAKLSVLWVEADGHRVTEDAWGTGEVKELRFKVGVKDIDGLAMGVGDKLVPVHPTDIITVRMFNGDFAYRNLGTSAATLQLQGTVKTTLLNAGSPTGKLTTATGGAAPQATDQSRGHRPVGNTQRVAFVTLGTGQDVDTVDVQNGGARLVTADDSTPSASPSTAGNMLAKWVKIDGKNIQEYTWGDGTLERIEFQAQTADASTTLLNFDSKGTTAPQGAHVLVRNFTGEYLVYQVSGGQLRLRLDGYAEAVTTGAEGGLPIAKAPGIPLPAFEVSPQPARTTDVVTFKDRSTDDGVIVYWRWNFGDGSSAALQDPTHRYARPGVYNVTLNVTDDDLNTIETTRQLVINNAEPVPDFDMLPRIVTTDTLVAFTDHSIDPDGLVTNWSWNFGDGQSSYARHPNHHFVKSGNLPVTLTITDDLGGKTTLLRQVLVRNAPPHANFAYTPTTVLAKAPIQFHSTSTDKDGKVVDAKWTFGIGSSAGTARGNDVTYTFPHPGLFDVALTVTDDGGDSDTVLTTISIADQPPVPVFNYSPRDIVAGVNVTFDGRLSTDPDGFIVLNEWSFGDGSGTEILRMINQCVGSGPANADCQAQVNQDATYDPFRTDASNQNIGYSPPPLYAPPPPIVHAFPHRGEYNVTLCVTDNLLNKSCATNSVHVNNSAPFARIAISPPTASRNQEILFADSTVDPDGDPHAIIRWVFDGVIDGSVDQTLIKSYPLLGNHTVTLVVQDNLGAMGSATRTYSVVNAGPIIRSIIVGDSQPPANVSISFTADAYDPDNSPGGLNYTWTFSDGAVRYSPSVNHSFVLPGDASVLLTVRDTEGGVAQGLKLLTVHIAPPVPNFVYGPSVEPSAGESSNFNDTSIPTSGPITKWTWDFGDHAAYTTTNPTLRNTTHTYAGPCEVTPRNCTATLTISSDGQPDVSRSRSFHVNSKPLPGFYVLGTTFSVHEPITFNDTATDPDDPPGGSTIDHRVWNFGDGTGNITWNDSSIQHTFVTPGQHTVTQTVVDDHGAADSLAKSINLIDAPPRAGWIVDPATPPQANTNVHFISAGHSTDPDGNATITSWSWDFGDGTPLFAGTVASVYQNPVHVFSLSGVYRVTLVVGDGSLESPPASGIVRAAADHQVQFLLNATLPSGQAVNLFGPGLEPELFLQAFAGAAPVHLKKSDLAPATGGALFTLRAGSWANGENVQVQLTVRLGELAYLTKEFTLHDTDGKADPVTGMISAIYVHFDVPLPLAATVMAEPDNDQGLLIAHGPGYSNGTVYHSITSVFHGRGHVAYTDGATPGGIPAMDSSLLVELRFIPLYFPAPLSTSSERDSFNVDNPVLGWCVAGRETADIAGDFTWRVRDTDCLGQPNVSLPGHWEVRVIASHQGSKSTISKPWSIFVDPTGLLATIYMP